MLPAPFQNALVLTGPTGSGKTELAIELAEQLGAEIVSMDSMALYRGMDISTAKPTLAEQQRIRHHLIDVLEPWESGSVAWWLERAIEICREIESRGRQVLFVGGTPLYLKALLFGLFAGPAAHGGIRSRLEKEAAEQGGDYLHRQLEAVDAESAARLHPKDNRRLIRALEVFELTGRPISQWQEQWSRPIDAGGPAETGIDRILCLDVPRRVLYERINRRVESMIEAGLLDEVKRMVELPRPISREAAQSLGYKELLDHLAGRCGLDEAKTRIQTRSRNFAKRQLTWFRHLPGCRFVQPELTFQAWRMKIRMHQ